LKKTCNEDPKAVYEHSKELIAETEADKEKLLDKIDSEVEKKILSEEEAAVMKENVETGAEAIIDEIKETNDTAVDNIDDSSDTEEYILRKPNK
jgi:hypothetical protein